MAAFAENLGRDATPDEVAAQLELARQCDAKGDGEAALLCLRRPAATGDLTAKVALGRHLMTQPPLNIAEGVKLTTEAAKEGSCEAAYLMALFHAAGTTASPSWRIALDFLQRAAELDQAIARRELALMAGDADLIAAIEQNANIPAGIWEPCWMSPELRIGIAEQFITPAICHWLVEKSRPHLKPAQTDDPLTGTPRYGNNRTNSSAEFAFADTGFILHLVRARISALTGPPTMAMEGSAVLHYAPGQQFFPHYDFLDTAEPGYARQVAEFGQRVLTFLIYLNEDFEGGETDFPKLECRYKGKTGDALFFWNVLPNGQTDQRMLHAGLPPARGEKFLFSQWVRGRMS
ncbi:MAG: prolyl 4-hydroxylase [Alphaproteobacteria bacterium]|nr:prolyl 4-hydroxylase [Alphaproteobacteria bacterium]